MFPHKLCALARVGSSRGGAVASSRCMASAAGLRQTLVHDQHVEAGATMVRVFAVGPICVEQCAKRVATLTGWTALELGWDEHIRCIGWDRSVMIMSCDPAFAFRACRCCWTRRLTEREGDGRWRQLTLSEEYFRFLKCFISISLSSVYIVGDSSEGLQLRGTSTPPSLRRMGMKPG